MNLIYTESILFKFFFFFFIIYLKPIQSLRFQPLTNVYTIHDVLQYVYIHHYCNETFTYSKTFIQHDVIPIVILL